MQQGGTCLAPDALFDAVWRHLLPAVITLSKPLSYGMRSPSLQ